MNGNLDARKYILSSLGVLCAMMFAIPRLSADDGNPDWPMNNATTVLSVWPDLAPGETSRETGTLLPAKSGETKPIDRVSDVRRPTLDVYPAKNNRSGTAVIILPGGGFTYVVPNLEGSEAAEWLNDIGITAFVLRYRTKESAEPGEPLWQRPLQDTQRAMRLIRHESQRWQLQIDRIGILAFSAGGHGYGVRDRPNSVISSWPARATDWLKICGLLDPKN